MTIPFPLDMYDVARFFSRVDVRDQKKCWQYKGNLSAGGYGTFGAVGETFYAHRFSYNLFHGKIPEDLVVRHKCDNPSCVNPYHLETGTALDNALDKQLRNRIPMGANNGNSKLTEKEVLEILLDTRSSKVVAKEYGVGKDTVLRIRRKQVWKHLLKSIDTEASGSHD